MLFWSVLSAAFIGPGTVTTASQAGAQFRLQLVWALTFSTIGTILLQETAARLTIASGKNLGQIIALQYGAGKNGLRIKWLVFIAVVFGCSAYQAGNLIGAVSGMLFFTAVPRSLVTLVIGLICGSLLWFGNFTFLSRVLSIMVAVMGFAFFYVAWKLPVSTSEWSQHFIWPSFPAGSNLLIIGLIGTTIVPYNLFLGSGIGQDQNIHEMRVGIVLAVLIGGIISIAILAAGVSVQGPYSYQALTEALTSILGRWAIVLFGLGLFAAGMSSAITAPWAAAITGQSLFGADDPAWETNATKYRSVWMLVLGIGLFFGSINLPPIPAIILAQAINGVLLPVVTVFLLFAANNVELLGKKYANGFLVNFFTLIIVGVTCFLGLNNIWSAINKLGKFTTPAVTWPQTSFGALTLIFMVYLGWRIFAVKKK
jgi:Mn2+/Fe2+ NRAMP family transporter